MGVDTTATISMLVADGEAFTLLLDLGTNVLGSGGLALDASALFLGSAAVSFASDTVTINPVPAQVEVDEPASLCAAARRPGQSPAAPGGTDGDAGR